MPSSIELRRAQGTRRTRTQLSAPIGRNRTATEIDAALRFLSEKDLVHSRSVPTDGRSAEMWFVTSGDGASDISEKKGE